VAHEHLADVATKGKHSRAHLVCPQSFRMKLADDPIYIGQALGRIIKIDTVDVTRGIYSKLRVCGSICGRRWKLQSQVHVWLPLVRRQTFAEFYYPNKTVSFR
jgi:hypothetical protein